MRPSSVDAAGTALPGASRRPNRTRFRAPARGPDTVRSHRRRPGPEPSHIPSRYARPASLSRLDLRVTSAGSTLLTPNSSSRPAGSSEDASSIGAAPPRAGRP